MSQYLRRLVADANWQASRPTLNQWLDAFLGNQPGYITLVGDDGKRLDPRTGTALSTGNYALTINSAAAKHLALGPSGSVLVAQNTGVTIGVPVALGGSAFTFTGTGQRLIGDLTNATLANRLLAQTSTANSPSSWGVIPSGSGTVGNLAAFNNAAPGSATAVAVLEGNSTSVQLRSDFLAGAGLPLDVYTNNTRQVRIDTAGLVSLTTALALGATPATVGAIRLTNTTGLFARNAANNADVSVAITDTLNNVLVGDSVTSPTAYLRALTTVNLRVGAADEVAVTSSLVTVTPDIALPGAVWTPFVPTATQSVTISPTVNLARYRIFGKLAIVQIKVTAAAVGTAANAIEIGTIPAAIAPKTTGASVPSGTFQVVPGGGSAIRMGLAVFSSSTAVRGLVDNNANYLGITPAYTIAVGDTVSCQLVFEIA